MHSDSVSDWCLIYLINCGHNQIYNIKSCVAQCIHSIVAMLILCHSSRRLCMVSGFSRAGLMCCHLACCGPVLRRCHHVCSVRDSSVSKLQQHRSMHIALTQNNLYPII